VNRFISTRTASIIATVIIIGYAIFQLCLILGAPWGYYAWGGANEVLPTPFRIGSAISILIYFLAISMILSRANVKKVFKSERVAYFGAWVFTVYFFVGILVNAASRSAVERYNVPFILVLAIMFLIVAKSKRSKS